MSNAIEPFNPQSYAEKLREKIKSALVDIVPDEQWEKLIKQEIETFFRVTSRNAYDHREPVIVPSDFQAVTRKVLSDEATVRVKKMLEGPEWTGVWDGNRQVAGKQIGDLLVEKSGHILSSWVGQAFQMVIDQMKAGRGY